ncbi:MAG: hypothetical protein P8X57_00405 [Cyclobacteriaceae bacterium]
MKKLLILFLMLFSICAFAQKTIDYDEDVRPSFSDRLFFGGGVGFTGGNGITSIQVNPIVGYMLSPRWSAGVGVEYQYVKYRDLDIDDNIWGGQVFTRYNIRQFFLQGEYNIYNYTQYYIDGSDARESIDRVLLGGGISQPIGRAGAINFVALYDLLHENGGPFGSPWVFRIFFSF